MTRLCTALAALVLGCTPAREPHLAAVRRTCGWDRDDAAVARLVVRASGEPELRGVPVGRMIVVGEPGVTMATARRAWEPLSQGVVRLKILVAPGELVPVTLPQPQPGPPPERAEVSIVGTERLTRERSAPRDRFAQLSLSGDEVRVFVENDAPRGTTVKVTALAAQLGRVQPPATVFGLTASDGTAWPTFVQALVAAACYDRRPGQEPHEVLWLGPPRQAATEPAAGR